MHADAAVARAKTAAQSARQSAGVSVEMLKRERAWAYFVVGSHASNRSLSEADAPAPRERRPDRSGSATD